MNHEDYMRLAIGEAKSFDAAKEFLNGQAFGAVSPLLALLLASAATLLHLKPL